MGEEKVDLNLFIETKIVWNDDYAQLYYNALLAEEGQEKLDFASRLIERDVNEALKVFNVVLKQGAECIKMNIH